MGASSWIHLDVEEIKAETDRAFLIVLDDGEHWIPKSHISDPDEYEKGDVGVSMSISEWIAEQKGIA